MENNQENNHFSYTYSAREQSEVRRIREKYAEDETRREETPLDTLRRLDGRVSKKAHAIALSLGVVGILILGFGMSLVMTELGSHLSLEQSQAMVIGIAVGLVGCIPVALAYPIYRLTLKRERKKIAPQILRLTDELMK